MSFEYTDLVRDVSDRTADDYQEYLDKFEGARPLYAHGYTIYEELYYLVSLASHFYD